MVNALEHNLQEQPAVPSPGKKPVKGFSKSKRAALILDAMKPILATAVDQVHHQLCSSAYMLNAHCIAILGPWVIQQEKFSFVMEVCSIKQHVLYGLTTAHHSV